MWVARLTPPEGPMYFEFRGDGQGFYARVHVNWSALRAFLKALVATAITLNALHWGPELIRLLAHVGG